MLKCCFPLPGPQLWLKPLLPRSPGVFMDVLSPSCALTAASNSPSDSSGGTGWSQRQPAVGSDH